MTFIESFRRPAALVELDGETDLQVNFTATRTMRVRLDGETALDAGGRARQLREEFDRTWERSRPCSEYRALGL